MSLTFADTHNMVAYLNKSDASEGFNQVIDFLNAAILIVKSTDDVTRLQAQVDRKKAVITEATIKDILLLDDAEGVNCLPNDENFAELASMGYEKPSTKLTFYKAFFSSQWKFLIHTILQIISAKHTSWNEFSSAMASAVICLSTEEQVQDAVDDDAAQGADTAVQGDAEALDACATLTRRVEHLEYDKVAEALEITKLKRRIIDSSDDTVMEDASNQGRMIDALDSDAGVALMDNKEAKKKVEKAKVAGDDQVKGRQAEIYQIDMDHASKVLSMQEDEPAEVQEVVDVVTTTKLIIEVVTATIRVAAASTRRRKGVVIRDLEEESSTIIHVDTKSKDKGKGIMEKLMLSKISAAVGTRMKK
nr:hypothetical protein [Tanacetum cinerariifolium]